MNRKYEGMFLFDPAATPDWEACRAELDRLMERNSGRMVAANKWDERRLAYEVKGRKRGIYGLTFFEMPPANLVALERDVNLSESVLRAMFLKADHLSEDEMVEVAAKPASTGESDDDQYRGGSSRDDRGSSSRSTPSGGEKAKPAAETSKGDDKAADNKAAEDKAPDEKAPDEKAADDKATEAGGESTGE